MSARGWATRAPEPVPDVLCSEPNPATGRLCTAVRNHEGRHIAISGSWPQDPGRCTDPAHGGRRCPGCT